MATETRTLGRRRLLLLVCGAAVYPACKGRGATLGCGGDLLLQQGAADASAEASIDAASDDANAPTGGGTDGAPEGPDAAADSGHPADAASSDSSNDSSDTVEAGDADSGGADAGCPVTATTLRLAFASYPALQSVGGSVTLTAMGYSDPICGESQIIVIQTSSGKYSALSTGCTHACCTVQLTGSQLVCPCCKATYDLQGHVLSGPTNVPLPVLATCGDAQAVYVSW